MKHKNVLLIELGNKTVKYACARILKGKRVIEGVTVHATSGPVSENDIAQIFSSVSKALFDQAVISLPRSAFLMRFLELPSSDRQELQTMIPFQLAKVIPSSLDEISYDFSLAQVKGGVAKVLLFLLQKKRGAFLFKLISKKQNTPMQVTLSSSGLYNWLINAPGRRRWPCVVIDVDHENAEFLVAVKEGILFSRSFPYQEQSQLIKGVEQSLAIFQKEWPQQILQEVVLTGRDDGIIAATKDQLPARLSGIQVISARAGYRLVGAQSGVKGHSCAALFGLSEVVKPLLDFSTQKIKEQHVARTQQRKLRDLAIVGIQILFLAGLFLGKGVYDKRAQARVLDAQLGSIRSEAKNLDQVSGKLKILEDELGKRQGTTHYLYGILSALPSQIKLIFLDFQSSGEFSLKGYAPQMSAIFTFVKALEVSDLFDEVKIKYAAHVKQKSSSMVEFYIYGKGQ